MIVTKRNKERGWVSWGDYQEKWREGTRPNSNSQELVILLKIV